MGWVQMREGRRPRAAWREDGKIRYKAFDTTAQCEQHLVDVDPVGYVAPEVRRRGRPAKGGDRHVPSLTGYRKHGCRCPGCKKIGSAYWQTQKARSRERAAAVADQ